MGESRWRISDSHVCALECEHQHCRAFHQAGGVCPLCTGPLVDGFFAFRNNGTGASHTNCRLLWMGRMPTLPRLVSEDGEFQIGIPRSDEEADTLRVVADAARRFLTAAEGALSAYGGGGALALREDGR